eukprot:CAMPEP_0181296652 /NCGR_PEP_ID=MMETSP1101-20121128/4819_1 /TAXON_ID=46948 /ORGANISM="Rhodomonas abbreviata, Strain Caron Lab Isolate" /LENGTH=440 /DNA_ID=CAMNT_0023401533 /DNA_START=220 /DNA_END=1539 /DNA_ORIENTATION=-
MTSSNSTAVEEEGCDECYVIGVFCALAGSSLQALGLSLWKLQHMKTEKEKAAKLAKDKQREGRIAAYVKHGSHGDDFPSETGRKNSASSHKSDLDGDGSDGSHEQRVTIAGEGGHRSEDGGEQEADQKGCIARVQWIWWLGFIIFAIGNGGDFIALGITKQSVVTLVGSWALVVNTFTASCLLHEIVHKLDVLASLFIIAGIVLTVMFSGQDSPEWPLDKIVEQYRTPQVIVMLAILATLTFSGLTVMHVDHVYRHKKADKNKALVEKPSRLIGALYCIVGSMVADFTVLFGKAFSGLLLPTLMGDNQFTSPFVVVVVLVFCVSLPSQIYLIDQSLEVNDALYHIPNFYVFWNVGSIITGAIYYEEMANFELRNWLGFFSGVLILFIGVYLTNVAAGLKAEALEEQQRQRDYEEWMGGGGNEDGLVGLYNHALWYDAVWE